MKYIRMISNRMLPYAPEHIQRWVRTKRDIRRIRKGFRLVPEEDLERKYIEVIRLLESTGGPEEPEGDYLEFGVYNGSSLACMHRALEKTEKSRVRLFGFDSFQGLPEEATVDDGGHWSPGKFSIEHQAALDFLMRQKVDWERVFLIKGWFSETLNEDLIRRHAIRRASIIMIDCDLYSSAKTALDFCAPLIGDRAVILFDDWYSGGLDKRNMGEKRAFKEFLQSNPQFRAKEIENYGRNSRIFSILRRR